ncbi:hypothetical protein [Spirochaeta thermophila]|uniref:Uncharacterized protein n=2 Tax=Winmispira thermophila TaxID=154 RepID=G0G9V6_WINT7|nr:hypothetical protein [Spirochaeta thermophila]ADN01521.1 hypothetical protein STHERM_c05560 [Spirochaeta thermophila DSM 6192]AEJ60856.1 hypothetical protein Spith_0576 [Spirochaeta thermophila DSM 6578]
MSKAHRGKGLKDQPKKGRGKCPLCGRTGVKLLYEVSAHEKKLSVCKPCSKAVAHGKREEALAALAE